jgi:hypothetical protein
MTDKEKIEMLEELNRQAFQRLMAVEKELAIYKQLASEDVRKYRLWKNEEGSTCEESDKAEKKKSRD